MRNFTVARIWGIPIQINVSLLVFLPILAWLIGSGGQIQLYSSIISGFTGEELRLPATQTVAWTVGVLAAVGLFVSVTLHELGHSWVALRYGIEIESITLWILGGIAGLKSIPKEWEKEFWIAIAGPATSVLVAAVCYAGVRFVPSSLPVVVFVVGWLAVTNFVLAVFNLLPAFPMDGGRILRALLARSRPHSIATQTAARIGVFFAFVFGFFGIINFNPILLLLAFFIYSAAKTESRVTLLDDLLEGLTVGDIMRDELDVIDTSMPLSELAQKIFVEKKTTYAVTQNGDVVGVVTLNDMKKVKASEMETGTVEDVVIRDPVRVSKGDDAFEALALLSQGGSDSALVEDDGEVVGVVTQSDYASLLEMRQSIRVPQ